MVTISATMQADLEDPQIADVSLPTGHMGEIRPHRTISREYVVTVECGGATIDFVGPYDRCEAFLRAIDDFVVAADAEAA